MYEPFLEHIANFFDYSEKGRQAVADPIANVEGFVTFAKQVTTYASDDAVEAYHKFNLATANNAPYPIVTRLMGDFLLAVRKDLSHPDTKVSGPILIATTFRVGDWYQQGEEFRKAMTLPLNQACKTLKWEPPWEYTDKTAVESPGSAKGDGSVDGGEGRSAGEGVDPEPLA